MANSRKADDKDSYRLKPTALNMLVDKFVRSLDASAESSQLVVGDKGACIQYHTLNCHDKIFHVFNMTKDSDNPDVEPDLLSISSVIQAFSGQVIKREDARPQVLLLPMRMCRGYFKLPDVLPESFHVRRKHAVLVELDVASKAVRIHDSQGVIRWLTYANINDKLMDGEVRNCHYYAYGRQGGWFSVDAVSCGYFVYEYIKHILTTGSSAGCENISVNIMSQCESMHDYLQRENVQLSQVVDEPDADSPDQQIETFEVADIMEDDELVKDGWVYMPASVVPVTPPVTAGWFASVAGWLKDIQIVQLTSLQSFSLFSRAETPTTVLVGEISNEPGLLQKDNKV